MVDWCTSRSTAATVIALSGKTSSQAQILFWMLRALDGHAENFSIQLLPGPSGRFRLTLLYDVLSAYSVIGDGPNQ